MAVEFPIKVADILSPFGGTLQTAVLTLLGIHSTKLLKSGFWSQFNQASTSSTKVCQVTSFNNFLLQKEFFMVLLNVENNNDATAAISVANSILKSNFGKTH